MVSVRTWKRPPSFDFPGNLAMKYNGEGRTGSIEPPAKELTLPAPETKAPGREDPPGVGQPWTGAGWGLPGPREF